MFGRKKKEKEPVRIIYDYSSWEKDVGFLKQCINDRLQICISYDLINFSNKLISDGDYIKGSDINERVAEATTDILSMLSKNYIEFLISKYYNGEKELIQYIMDMARYQLTKSAISANVEKINKVNSKNLSDKILSMNK